MKTVKIVYGSTTGATAAAAIQLAGLLDAPAVSVAQAVPEDFQADLLILGSSTWGYGELQDDWFTGITMLDGLNLHGCKAAVFGTGDSCGFSDTFVNAIGILADKAVERGATLVGQVSAEGYPKTGSFALRDGSFVGLPLDETNEPELTGKRLSAWAKTLQAALD